MGSRMRQIATNSPRRRRVIIRGVPNVTKKSAGAQRKIAEMKQIKSIPYTGSTAGKAITLSNPSWYMGQKTVPKWVANPSATYKVSGNGTIKEYTWPMDSEKWYVAPMGSVVKITNKGEMYLYPDGLYEDAPYQEINSVPAWLKDII